MARQRNNKRKYHKVIPDAFDLQILAALQENPRAACNSIARRLHLSNPAVVRRVQKLEQHGLMPRGELDPKMLGFSITVMVKVRTRDATALLRLSEIPNVVRIVRVSDDWPYLVVMLARSEQEFIRLMTDIKQTAGIQASAMLVFETLYERKGLPLDLPPLDSPRPKSR